MSVPCFRPDRLAVLDRALAAYVDDGVLPGWQLVVGHHGSIAHQSCYGLADVDAGRPVAEDTVFAIHSLTKPVTAVALMILCEEGLVDLATPVAELVPAFADARVLRPGNAERAFSRPATEPVRVWHLLTHTAGLSYGYEVAEAGRARHAEPWETHVPGASLAEAADAIASAPLLYEPGTAWNYSRSFDVVGRLVEVLSGVPFDAYVRSRVLDPLGMTDTTFAVPDHDAGRRAAVYLAVRGADPAGGLGRVPAELAPPPFPSGGGGLYSTARDYHRFGRMLLEGGSLEGERILSPRTVEYMARNHLPGGADLEQLGGPHFEIGYAGVGHGLGFAVVVDAAASKVVRHEGEVLWAGAAGAAFWVDPRHDVVVVFLANLAPHTTYPIDARLRQLVYQAMSA